MVAAFLLVCLNFQLESINIFWKLLFDALVVTYKFAVQLVLNWFECSRIMVV